MHKISDDLLPLATPIDDLDVLDGNPRIGDVDAVARSYDRFGQQKPIVARRRDGRAEVLAGNHQLKAARQLGWSEIAVTWANGLTDDEARGFALADNRTGDLGTYDNDLLAELLSYVADDADLLAATGYDEAFIDSLIDVPDLPDDVDDVPAVPSTPVTVLGDVWLLGAHRVICGDCRDAEVVSRLLDGATINVAVTSPPYADRRKYDETSGFRPIPPDEYVDWFRPVSEIVADHLAGDGSWFVNIKPGAEGLDTDLYVHDLVAAHVRQWGWHFATELCWERNGVPKQVIQRFKNQFEPVYQFTRGRWKMRPENVRHRSENSIMSLGEGSGDTSWSGRQGNGGVIPANRRKRKHTSTKSNADSQGVNWQPGESTGDGWAFPGNRLPTFVGSHEATGHTAAFPVGLPEWLIKAYSDDGDFIYDPFTGSGSTLIAAHQTARTFYGVEISPGYVDVICRRFQDRTGIVPVLESSGESVDFL